MLRNARHANDGVDAVSLNESRDYLNALFRGKAIHDNRDATSLTLCCQDYDIKLTSKLQINCLTNVKMVL